MKRFVLPILVLAALTTTACSTLGPSADQQQRRQQEQASEQSNVVAGMPNIVNFFEKKQMRRIMEMRDDPHLQTYTYVRDMNGKLHTVCASIGYPIPGAMQYTNPQKLASEYQYPNNGTGYPISASGWKTVDGVIPQADPNGLFSPAVVDATWVLCQNPQNPNDLSPHYNENKVEVFTWKMPNAVD